MLNKTKIFLLAFLLLLGSLTLISKFAHSEESVFNTLSTGRQTVTTAGTRVQLSTNSIPCTRVVITAETDNTGIITVGGSSVVAALATRQGIPLSSGDSLTAYTNNINKIYLDSTVDTDGVTFAYYL